MKRLLAAGANPRIANREGHLEWLLDQALEATFPASDPIAVSPPVEPR